MADAIDKETLDAAAKFIEQLAAGKCPTCGKDIEPSKIVGRCRYGACGHRIGVVR